MTEQELEQKIVTAWYDLRGMVVTDRDRARSVARALGLMTDKKKWNIGWGPTMTENIKFIPAYDGDDMAGYIMAQGFEIPKSDHSKIKSITNVGRTAIIVTEREIWLAEPSYQIGFCIKLLCHLYG